VLYLGEINTSQREAWRKTIEDCDEGQRRQVALLPAGFMPGDDVDAVGVRLSELRLVRPRQWGAGWRCSCGRNSNSTPSGARGCSPRAKARRG